MMAFTKMLRDLRAARGRIAFMVLALAAGLTSTGAVLAIRAVVQREMTRSYLNSVPASITFDVGSKGISDQLLTRIRARPEVKYAERRATLEVRWRRAGQAEWGRALLFVIESFEAQQVARLALQPLKESWWSAARWPCSERNWAT
jgi:hypothetical protein